MGGKLYASHFERWKCLTPSPPGKGFPPFNLHTVKCRREWTAVQHRSSSPGGETRIDPDDNNSTKLKVTTKKKVNVVCPGGEVCAFFIIYFHFFPPVSFCSASAWALFFHYVSNSLSLSFGFIFPRSMTDTTQTDGQAEGEMEGLACEINYRSSSMAATNRNKSFE